MKKGLRKVLVLAMAGIMAIAPAMTASAETVVSGGTYQVVYPDVEGRPPKAHQVIVSDTPLRKDISEDHKLWRDIANEAKAGYEMKGVYIYYPDTLLIPNEWSAGAEHSGEWAPTPYFSEYGAMTNVLTKTYTFTVNMNGKDYPDCAFYFNYDFDLGEMQVSNNLYTYPSIYSRCYAAFRLPVGYTGNAYFKVYDYDDQNVRTGHSLDYYFYGNGETAAPATAAASPSWKQDAKGWWIENPDGTYLKDQWFQSPASGLWYYMGADGYMLTNTTTPDGYKVNADGIWIS